VFVRRDSHVPPLQPLYDGPYAILHRSLHHFTLRIGDKEDKVSTLWLKPCTDPTVTPAQPRVRGCPPAAGIFPRQGPQWLAGYTSPRSSQQNCAGNHFPLASRQEFLHAPPPFSTMPLGPPATAEHLQIRPLGLRPRGLGGALWRLQDDLRGHGCLLGIPIIYCAHTISAHGSGGPHTCETRR
jgi:hypothetical protein